MSDDIVDRLRKLKGHAGPNRAAHGLLMAEAADEVERLRADLDVLRRVLILCAHDYEFDVTIYGMTVWPDFNGYGTLRRLLAEADDE